MVHMSSLALYETRPTLLRPRIRRVRDGRRRSLEAAGWRTWLTYCENHRRGDGGRMIGIDERWQVEMEHLDGRAITVEATSSSAAWSAAYRAARSA
jgi:hypothetical protein